LVKIMSKEIRSDPATRNIAKSLEITEGHFIELKMAEKKLSDLLNRVPSSHNRHRAFRAMVAALAHDTRICPYEAVGALQTVIHAICSDFEKDKPDWNKETD
jgi:hypothetical protein